MRIGRTLPPAAAPIYLNDIINGLKGAFKGQREVERFREELKNYFGVKHCFLVSSGKAALTIILQTLHELHPERDEVIIPAFTCYSVPSAVKRAGLTIRLCDNDLNTLDFDFDQLEKILAPQNPHTGKASASSRLLAVLPTHLFGIPADVDRVKKLRTDPDMTIIEDAAQAMGGKHNSRKLGALGDIGFFSLGRGKSFSTVEGGVIITSRDDIAEKINGYTTSLPSYGCIGALKLIVNSCLLALFQRPAFFWLPKGLPFIKVGDTIYDPNFKIYRLSFFQAGLSLGWRNKLKTLQKRRRQRIQGWTSQLEKRYKLYCTNQKDLPAFIRFPIRVANNAGWEKILKVSETRGLGIMATYPNAINEIKELRKNFPEEKYPIAKELSKTLLTLPVHPFVSSRDIKRTVLIISQNVSAPEPAKPTSC